MIKRILILTTGILIAIGLFTTVNADELSNPQYQLKSVTGEEILTLAEGKPKILFFFNTECIHCLDIEKTLKTGYSENVDFVMAESSKEPLTKEEAEEFFNKCEVKATYCYDANEICWKYLRYCGYEPSIVVKPVIIYIDANNKIKGYTTSGVDIFAEAAKRGICLGEHDYIHHVENATYFTDGKSYDECTVCHGKTNEQVIQKLKLNSTKIKKAKRKRKQIKLYWKKGAGNTGYQIKYSVSSKMKNAKKITVKGKNKTAKKIKLKKNWKYWFSIRTYKKSGKMICYSAWSESRAY